MAEKERGLFCVEAILMGAGLVQFPPMIASLVGCGAKKPLFVIDATQQGLVGSFSGVVGSLL